MRMMSDEGVSSVEVVDEATGGLLSAVSVTDVGRVVVPAQSNQILAMSLKQFVARIKVGCCCFFVAGEVMGLTLRALRSRMGRRTGWTSSQVGWTQSPKFRVYVLGTLS